MVLTTGGAKDFGTVNKDSFESGKKTVTVAGTAEQLPNQAIPHGFTVIVKALNSNTNTVHVAKSKANAEDNDNNYPLEKNEFVTYHVTNLNKIWVDANVSGEGVSYTVEVD